MRGGLMAEFTSPEALISGVRAMREAGYRGLDAFSPYPIKEAWEAMDLPRSKLPVAIFVGGALFGALALLLMWWTNGYDYPLNVGSFPPNSLPTQIPIAFETTVLFGALSGFFGFFIAAQLPRLWDPVFEVDGFDRSSIDRFFVAVADDDPRFSPELITSKLTEVGAIRVVPFGRAR